MKLLKFDRKKCWLTYSGGQPSIWTAFTPSPLQTFVQVKEDEESRSSAAEPKPAELDPVSF